MADASEDVEDFAFIWIAIVDTARRLAASGSRNAQYESPHGCDAFLRGRVALQFDVDIPRAELKGVIERRPRKAWRAASLHLAPCARHHELPRTIVVKEMG
jgi:hypothetical protein